MAWPRVVFVGENPYIIDRLAHLTDFDPYDLEVVTYKPDDAPTVLSPTVVAVVVDEYDLRLRYAGVPTLCHARLSARHGHLGKWSISIKGFGMDSGLDSLENGPAHVSDDHEVRQFCILFLLAAIEQSFKSESQVLTSDERHGVVAFSGEMSRYLDTHTITGDAADAIRLSIESMRLELGNPILDREIVRRCLYRIDKQVAGFATSANLVELRKQLTDLLWTVRAPSR